MTFDLPQRLARLQSALASGRFDQLAAAFNECADISPRPMMVWLAKAELRRLEGRIADAAEAARQGLRAHPALAAPLASEQPDWPALVEVILAHQESELLSWRNAVRYYSRLTRLAGSGVPAQDELAAILAAACSTGRLSRFGAVHVVLLFDFIGFLKEGSEPWCEQVLHHVARPMIEHATRAALYDVALAIEECIYTEHVKRRDSSAWFRHCIDGWLPALSDAMPEQLALHPWQAFEWKPESTRRVAFFVHTATLLAHVLVLLETLSACHRIGMRNYKFTVFVLARENADMAAAFEQIGVKTVFLQRDVAGSYLARLKHLANRLRTENFAACVWVSLVTIMGMAFACRIAPLQIWWSMKYHYCPITGIDERFAVENVVRFKQMEGLQWRTIGSASTNWFAADKSDRARQLRAEFGEAAVVCGSIGREEKLSDPVFLKTICQLLNRHANMVFLWTGKAQPPEIVRAFTEAGVAARTRFIGWVDTKLYAQVIDIFLDSFPFPCGFTLKEAMAAGKAAVMLRTAESLETGVPGAFDALQGDLAGEDGKLADQFRAMFTRDQPLDLLMCAASVDEYAAMADRLLAEPSLRAACGNANRQFIESFLSNPDAEGRKFLDHLDEIFAHSPRLNTGLAP